MEIFKYRNLVFASFFFLVALFASYYFNNTVRIATLALSGAAFLLLLTVPLISRGKRGLSVMIRYTPASVFIILAMTLSLVHFDKSSIEKYCDGSKHEITGQISQVIYSSDYFGTYEIEITKIDGDEVNETVSASMHSTVPAKKKDIIKSTGFLRKHQGSELGFDSQSYYLSHGITVGFEGDSFEIVGCGENELSDYFEMARTALDNRLSGVNDELTHSILSALFLGNKEHLSTEVERDFSRVGLSHVLALSGMHIAIVVTLLGYALFLIPIHRTWKEIILVVATLCFVALTGFSESALRAGIMASLTYTLFFFGNRLSLTTSLFYSVTIICAFNPFSIFSMSLALSFLAMLGCIFSSRVIRSLSRLRRLKPRILRYVAFSLLSSVIILLFTLPLVSFSFGRISLLSPITNLLLGPLFSLLILLSPVYLALANVPYASEFISWLCRKISHAAVTLGNTLSDVDNIVLPIKTAVQAIGVILIAASLVCMLIFSKKLLLIAKIGGGVGVGVLACGSIILFSQREANVYASAYNFGTNDVLCIEDSGDITVIDITKSSVSSAAYSLSAAEHLGYYEIDNFVITDLSASTGEFFERVSGKSIVRNVYMANPRNEKEKGAYLLVNKIAKERGVNVYPLGASIKTSRSNISFLVDGYLPRSTKSAVAVSIECENAVFTYLGASAFEINNKFADTYASISDVIVFGAYGPKYKTPFYYEAPFLDYTLFFGESKDYATEEFYNKIKHLETNATRFCLTP